MCCVLVAAGHGHHITDIMADGSLLSLAGTLLPRNSGAGAILGLSSASDFPEFKFTRRAISRGDMIAPTECLISHNETTRNCAVVNDASGPDK